MQQTTPVPKPAPQRTVPAYQPSRPNEADLKAWYRKAAEQGDKYGEFYLAVYYANGYGGLCKDKQEALKWYMKADEHGHPWAKDEIKQLS